jgi:hypothetical protein
MLAVIYVGEANEKLGSQAKWPLLETMLMSDYSSQLDRTNCENARFGVFMFVTVFEMTPERGGIRSKCVLGH